ncbi:MAG TPA: hypothetical protein VLK58_14560 [Conexibacter sp.]|nr:hypothetical protein [Conexibacter sp.]
MVVVEWRTIAFIAIGCVVASWLVAFTCRLHVVSRHLWSWSRPRGRREPDRWHPPGRRLAARQFAGVARRPLRIVRFSGPGETEPELVAAALGAAMGRLGAFGRSSVDVVTAPTVAGSTVDDIAKVVRLAPKAGDAAEAMFRLFWLVLGRRDLQLRGCVLMSSARGPGLTLTLATSRGRVRDRETLWADEFEQTAGEDDPSQTDVHDRVLRLAVAGAVWAHYAILATIWGLRAQELRVAMQTPTWRSYAAMQIALDGRDRRPDSVTMALDAMAVEHDQSNLMAQFNLAAMELRERDLAQVRPAGEGRLRWLHRALEEQEMQRLAASRQRTTDARDVGRLLARDTLHYQVVYKLVASATNDEIEEGARPAGERRGITAAEALELADGHAYEMLATLLLLDDPRGTAARIRRRSDRREWEAFREVLTKLEGPFLALWAMLVRRQRLPDTRVEVPSLERPLPRARAVQAVKQAISAPDADLARAVGLVVAYVADGPQLSSRSRYNLACWYTDNKQWDEALKHLELCLQSGGRMARWALDDLERVPLEDPQLMPLRNARPMAWRAIERRYGDAQVPHPAKARGNDGARKLVVGDIETIEVVPTGGAP